MAKNQMCSNPCSIELKICMPLKDKAHVREPTISGVARKGAMGADHPGRHFKGGAANLKSALGGRHPSYATADHIATKISGSAINIILLLYGPQLITLSHQEQTLIRVVNRY